MRLSAHDVLGVGRVVEQGTRRAGEGLEQVALRALDTALRSSLARDAVDKVLASALAAHAAETVLRGPLVEALAADLARYRVIERVAAGPELERIVEEAIDTPAARRLVAHVIESGVVDEAVSRLLESEELWILVDEVARSPSVTDAISHQGAGLADQVAEVVRGRSRHADARLERVARRMLGRDPRANANGAGPRAEE